MDFVIGFWRSDGVSEINFKGILSVFQWIVINLSRKM